MQSGNDLQVEQSLIGSEKYIGFSVYKGRSLSDLEQSTNFFSFFKVSGNDVKHLYMSSCFFSFDFNQCSWSLRSRAYLCFSYLLKLKWERWYMIFRYNWGIFYSFCIFRSSVKQFVASACELKKHLFAQDQIHILFWKARRFGWRDCKNKRWYIEKSPLKRHMNLAYF